MRQEERMKTHDFKQRMKHRNAIEGTQSELVRAHGLRHARYRGLAKVKLQNYFIGAACNVKRWIRCELWKLRQAGLVAAQVASATVRHSLSSRGTSGERAGEGFVSAALTFFGCPSPHPNPTSLFRWRGVLHCGYERKSNYE